MRTKALLLLLVSCLCASAAFTGQPVLKFNLTRADGSRADYLFMLPDSYVSTAAPVSDPNGELQHNAGVAALTWAKQFYAAHDVYLKGVDLKQAPAPYFLADFQGQVGNQEQVFFAVVLLDNTIVEPALTAPTAQ
jgi:hypothetical protein